MKLKLKNVGKIKTADIKLNGITVIAGENNTGKSTIGKTLYCLFHSFYKVEEQISEERQKTISRVLSNYYRETTNRYTMRFTTWKIASYLVENKDELVKDISFIEDELLNFYSSSDKNFPIQYESMRAVAQKICDLLNISDDEIRKSILRKRLEAEFGMKVAHLNSLDSQAEVELEIKDSKISVEIIRNQEIIINNYLSLIKEIIYIDDPFVLDELDNRDIIIGLSDFSHREDLISKILGDGTKNDFSVIDELLVDKKIENILDSMKEVCDGDLVSTDDSGRFAYKTDKLDGALDVVNLSTGLKSFVILRTLLQKGRIDENGVIILDEPEIHLHPEWQLRFAEIIVLIQKEFKTNILLTTHSPYFLNAIEVYSEKHNIVDKCNYYMADENDNRTAIIDVTDERELIYAKLARPLQELENMGYRDGYTT